MTYCVAIKDREGGKPVLDRVITPETPLDEAAKCALVSMDSTIKSNLSAGLRPSNFFHFRPLRCNPH